MKSKEINKDREIAKIMKPIHQVYELPPETLWKLSKEGRERIILLTGRLREIEEELSEIELALRVLDEKQDFLKE